jgi:hypothetical protein
MAIGNITLPEDVLPKLEEAARAENRTADDLAKEAVENLRGPAEHEPKTVARETASSAKLR